MAEYALSLRLPAAVQLEQQPDISSRPSSPVRLLPALAAANLRGVGGVPLS
jgi:hypothetical protein